MHCKETLSRLLKNASILSASPRLIQENNLVEKLEDLDNSKCRIHSCLNAVRVMGELMDIVGSLDLRGLEEEYTRLFVSSYPHVPCPPYESAYVGRDRFLAEPSVLEDLNAILASLGMELNKDLYRFPDSLPVELELAHILLSLEESDPQAVKPLTRTLLVGHLSKWLPIMSKCIEDNASTPYYKLLAQLLYWIGECIRELY